MRTRTAAGRDAEAARRAAAERVAVAQRIADAVEAYHVAADRIDAATRELAGASADRLEAIGVLRSARLTISEIGELTGLSTSRIQALVKEALPDSADTDRDTEDRTDDGIAAQ